jgi:basic amino acid/polyamine antiporter, APA family
LSARFTLLLFAIVNLALIRIKAREAEPPRHIYLAPGWVPRAGLASCLALLLIDLGMRSQPASPA